MSKGSLQILRLFIAVFYVGGSAFALWDIMQMWQSDQPIDYWSASIIPLLLVYCIGGAFLLVRIQHFLPRFRKVIVRAITSLFVVDVLTILIQTPYYLAHPELWSREAGSDPTTTTWIVATSLLSIGFGFLVYSVVITNINRLSGVERTQSGKMTMLYWGIVMFFLLSMLALMYAPDSSW